MELSYGVTVIIRDLETYKSKDVFTFEELEQRLIPTPVELDDLYPRIERGMQEGLNTLGYSSNPEELNKQSTACCCIKGVPNCTLTRRPSFNSVQSCETEGYLRGLPCLANQGLA